MQRHRPLYPRINMRAPLANGLVFAGLGGGASTNAYFDSSPYGNHGTLTGQTPNWTFNNTLQRWVQNLNGTGYITCGAICNPGTGDFSICCWSMFSPQDGSPLSIFNMQAGAYWVADSIAILRSPSTYTVFYKSAAALFHLCVQRASGVLSLFHNGIFVTSHAETNSLSGSLYWGTDGGGWRGPITGLVSDCLYYQGRALSPAEISALADPSNVMLSGLILPPRRRLWAVSGGAAPAGFKAYWAGQATKVAV